MMCETGQGKIPSAASDSSKVIYKRDVYEKGSDNCKEGIPILQITF